MRRLAVLAVALWACLGAGKPPAPAFKGMALYAEGGAFTIVRHDKLLTGSQGVTVQLGDMIDTGPNAFVAIRASDGSLIGLGHSTSVYLLQLGHLTTLFVTKGWVKVDARSDVMRLAGPRLGLQGRTVVMLLHVDDQLNALFVEQGTAKLIVREAGVTRAGKEVGSSQFFSLDAEGELASQTRPSDAFIAAMPVPFQDTLPERPPSGLNEREAAQLRPVTYADVQAWLIIPRELRGGFIQRFSPRLADPAFRAALDAHLNLHPEWKPVLYPEPAEGTDTPTAHGKPPPTATPEPGSEKK